MRVSRTTHHFVIKPIGLEKRIGERVAAYYSTQEEGILRAQNGDFYIDYGNGRRHQILHTEKLNFEDGLYLVDLIEK